MRKDSFAYFVLVRGAVYVGAIGAVVYLILTMLLEGIEIQPRHWRIVLAAPIIGCFWGIIMWSIEWIKRRSQKGQ